MKFDFCIGNPPYQEEIENNGRQNPVYNYFMDAAYEIADCTELITPGRFLFDAGQTPKAWNQKMLNDEHLKVLFFESDASSIFCNTEIKGGVAITFYNKKCKYNPIGIFTKYTELNSILQKINSPLSTLDTIISSRGTYRFSKFLINDFPFIPTRLGTGTGNMMASNFFDKVPEVYKEERPNEEYIGILSRKNNRRTICYIKRK